MEGRIEINPKILAGKPIIRGIKAAIIYAERLVENEEVYPIIVK